jgi:hypothetical protein
LSRFYGFNLLKAPPDELFTFDAAMPGLRARDILRERGTNGFKEGEEGSGELYRLMMTAFGDKEAAEDAVVRKEQAEIDAKDGGGI